MGRPSSGTDLKIKAAGKRLLLQKGLTGFSLRETCRLAGVNTGMFRYYFGSKEEFIREVLKEMYAEFMVHFKAGVSVPGDPRERLKKALIEVGRFAVAIRRIAPVLFADLVHARKEAFEFLSGNFTEHISYAAVLIEECRPASATKAHSVPFMLGVLLPMMVFPVLAGGIMERNGIKKLRGSPLDTLMEEFFSEEGISERAEIALRGVGL